MELKTTNKSIQDSLYSFSGSNRVVRNLSKPRLDHFGLPYIDQTPYIQTFKELQVLNPKQINQAGLKNYKMWSDNINWRTKGYHNSARESK